MVAALALALPIAFAAALAGRDDETDAEQLPEGLADEGPELGRPVRCSAVFHDGRAWAVSVGDRGVIGVAHESGEPAPSVLAYWTASQVADELPADAVLIGSVGERERRYELRPPASSERGHVVFFSLALGEVVGAVSIDASGH